MTGNARSRGKAFFALLGAAALINQWIFFLPGPRTGGAEMLLANFFSYYTIQTNIMITVYFALSFMADVRKLRTGGFVAVSARMTVLQNAAVVALVYWAVLAREYFPTDPAGLFNNFSLHLVLPAAVIGYLFIDRPAAEAPFTSVIFMLAYPALYCIYSLARGSITGWYPYFFLDAGKLGGTVPLIVSLAILSVFFIACAALTRLAWNRMAS